MSLDEVYGLIPLGFLRFAFFAFGLLWGSFLNVVIYRVPRELSVVRPGSHCPGCGKPIAGYDNIPVVSYLVLRGRARCCGVRMSPRYPLVELIGGALSLAIFEVILRDLPGATSLAQAAAIYCADFSLCLGLVAAAFIDAEHMYLPDSITLGGIVVGVVTASLRGVGWKASLLGAAIGFISVWLPFNFLYRGLLGRTGMGLGDAKLVALAGAWFGWPGAVFAFIGGAVHGTVYAGVTKLLGIEPKLPEAVRQEIEELEKLAAEGDEEAKEALRDDPLTEDKDAFIVRFFERLFERIFGKPEVVEPVAKTEPPSSEEAASKNSKDLEQEEEDEPAPARLPFGPFIILALLEFLFAEEWLRTYLPYLPWTR